MVICSTSVAGHDMHQTVSLLLKNDKVLFKPTRMHSAGSLVNILDLIGH